MKKNVTIILVSVFITLSFSCKQNVNNVTTINEDTFEVNAENEKIKLAVKEAQETLDYFIEELSKHAKDTNYWFVIKTKFESADYNEHMWVSTLGFDTNHFTGILINEPYWVQNVSIGDTVKIIRTDIEDWVITNDVKQISEGDFTEKYLFEEQ
ncbi:alpha amylase N-terminal ig-like domain-containing protein [uncultured Psychroserpens sp.]|uniref:alpha amylase N-terminal ig-like domain-containing protein n=1 Tax=uncultured Psychroserpens sp. TaxID=255436 RepID=UPI002605CEFD|nr:alpha amylase N-terminal ig-like domain-containing protein [uncultured Psychroserpens sp.]